MIEGDELSTYLLYRFLNHALYFAVMSKNENNDTRLPDADLLREIEEAFGSFAEFKEKFTAEALTLFGSGK